MTGCSEQYDAFVWGEINQELVESRAAVTPEDHLHMSLSGSTLAK
jgi:hypothetical protein